MIDTHAHLGDDADEVLERARARGRHACRRRRDDARGRARGARARRSATTACTRASASIRTRRRRSSAATLDELRALLAHPKAWPSARRGSTTSATTHRTDAQQRLFDAQLALARDIGKPVVIHTRAADDDTLRAPRRHDGPVILHCFSSPPLLEPALEHGWYVSFAGNVTYKNAYELRAAARRVPADRLLAETDSPYLAPQPVRGRRNEPAYVAHHLRRARRGARRRPRRAGAQIERTRTRSSACERRAAEEPRPALSRRREHPRRDRPARGARSRGRRARGRARARGAHAVPRRAGRVTSTQPSSTAGSSRTSRASASTTVHWGDALASRPRALSSRRRRSSSRTCRTTSPRRSSPRVSPRPVRALVRDGAARGRRPVLRRAVDEGVRRGLRARPARDRAHGPPSRSRARCSGRGRTSSPRSSRSGASGRVQTPRGQARRRGGLRAPAQDACELALARRASRRATAPSPRSRRSGAPRTCAREVLEPHEFVALRRGAAMIAPAPAKINLALVVGPRRADGKHELATVYQRVDLGDRITVEPAAETSVGGFPADTIVRTALAALAAPHGWRVLIEKHVPVAAGLGGGSSDAATALRLANAQLAGAALGRRAARPSPRSSVPTCRSFSDDGPQLGTGDGTSSSRSTCRRTSSCCCFCRAAHSSTRPPRSTPQFDARGGEAGWRGAAGRAPRGRCAPCAVRATSPRCRRTTSRARRSRANCSRHGAFRADVSGAGPAVYGLFHQPCRRRRVQPPR